MSEQLDFRFQVSLKSPYATLIKYLSPKNKFLEFPRQNMIIWALAAFWYPLACKWVGGFSDAELKLKARTAIYQLQQQIIYLAQAFGLENELGTQGIWGHPSSANPGIDSDVDASTSISVSTPISGENHTHLASLMNRENDELLEEAFN